MSTRTSSPTSFKVLLVAQSPVLRYGLRTALESIVACEDVSEAAGALEASSRARSVRPELVVIHDVLPGVTGPGTASMLRRLLPHARIVLLSDDTNESRRAAVRRIGADALLSMTIDPDEFAAAMDDLIQRSSSAPADRLISEAPAASSNPVFELAVLDGVVRGLPAGEIARHLQVDEANVTGEIDALLARLGVADRASAVIVAVRLGLAVPRDQYSLPAFVAVDGIAFAA